MGWCPSRWLRQRAVDGQVVEIEHGLFARRLFQGYVAIGIQVSNAIDRAGERDVVGNGAARAGIKPRVGGACKVHRALRADIGIAAEVNGGQVQRGKGGA